MNLGADCVCGFRFPSKASFLDASTQKRVRLERVFVHDGIKIPSRTIVLQAWLSSVVSCVVSPILNMGFFPNALS